MKRLTLLRHAKSSWDDVRLDDHDRPLSKRGLRDAPRMGERLARHGLEPDLLLTSSARRARQTAELIEPAFRHARAQLVIEPAIYLASPGDLLAMLAAVDDAIDELILIGHNPGLTVLANMLLPELALDNLPTAGAVAVDCDTPGWSTIDSAAFRLRFHDYPKKVA